MAVCVSVCLSLAAFPHYCTDPDVTWGNGRGCPVVVHYLADLQSVHAFRCSDNIAPNAKCQRVLVRVFDQTLSDGHGGRQRRIVQDVVEWMRLWRLFVVGARRT